MKKIFIGSSFQAREKAHIIKDILEVLGATVTHWNDTEAFGVAEITIDDLIKAAHEHDAGVFVLNCDDQIVTNSGNKYVTRDNVIAEAGMFMGVLGRNSVVLCLCTSSEIHVPTDFNGITTLQYDIDNRDNLKKRLKKWLDNNVKEHIDAVGEKNVLMLSRKAIHDHYSIDKRLHISDNLYKQIYFIRVMNLASNIIINPDIAAVGHITSNESLSVFIQKIMKETKSRIELMLVEPNEHNLNDLKTKIANYRAGSSMGTLYSALETLYNNLSDDTIYSQRARDNLFQLYVMKTSMPFGIFNVEFLGEASKYNHVKVDLYSASLYNEDDRRSFIIWQDDDPDNYKFFVDNFNSIKNNNQLCESPSIEQLKEWSDIWKKMK